jgi:hypothetical protein
VAYGRDGVEGNIGAMTYESEAEFLRDARRIRMDYVYLFRAGRWLYRNVRCVEEWREAKA